MSVDYGYGAALSFVELQGNPGHHCRGHVEIEPVPVESLPHAMGHRFGAGAGSLLCLHCGVHWEVNRSNPKRCTGA